MTSTAEPSTDLRNRPAGHTDRQDPGVVVLFDGVCNLCNGWVNFVIDRDKAATIRFAALQSEPGKRLLADQALGGDYLDSIVLIERGVAYVQSTAALRVAGYLAWPWRALSALRVIPRPIRDWVYRLIASKRYRWFGKQDVCRIPTAELKSHFLD